jgi:hypothetical protein
MVVEHMPLCGVIVDILVPMCIEWRGLQDFRKRIAVEEVRHRNERRLDAQIESARNDAKLAFVGPVSYARQACRTSLVDRRMKAIEASWYSAVKKLRQDGLGITIH